MLCPSCDNGNSMVKYTDSNHRVIYWCLYCYAGVQDNVLFFYQSGKLVRAKTLEGTKYEMSVL